MTLLKRQPSQNSSQSWHNLRRMVMVPMMPINNQVIWMNDVICGTFFDANLVSFRLEKSFEIVFQLNVSETPAQVERANVNGCVSTVTKTVTKLFKILYSQRSMQFTITGNWIMGMTMRNITRFVFIRLICCAIPWIHVRIRIEERFKKSIQTIYSFRFSMIDVLFAFTPVTIYTNMHVSRYQMPCNWISTIQFC